MGWEEAEELPLSAEVFSPSQHSQTSEPRKEFSFLPDGSLLEEWFDLVCKIKAVLYLSHLKHTKNFTEIIICRE